MVTTNIERLDGELNEVLNEFANVEELNIEVKFIEKDNVFEYLVICDGKINSYSFNVHFIPLSIKCFQ